MTGFSQEHVDALAARLFGALERGDLPAYLACYHPDARIWHSRDEADTDLEQNHAAELLFFARVSNRRFEVLTRDYFDGGFVQEHVVHGTLEDGSALRLPVLFIAHLGEDGRFLRVAEYLNSERSPLKGLVQHSV